MTSGGILKRLRVSTRVVLAGLLITGCFVATTFIWLLPRAERALIQRKREQIRDATEIAWSVLSHYHRRVVDGEMALTAAKEQAAAIVSEIRYGPQHKDYFWINDTVPCMVMHPYRPDLNGKDVSEHRDPEGKALFVEFVGVAREHGQGYVDYLWQWHDDPDRIVPKISYIRQFRPWNWIVGTGIYIQDVKEEIHDWRTAILVVYLLLSAAGAGVSAFAGQEVARSVRLHEQDPKHDTGDNGSERGEWSLSLGSAILWLMFPPLLALSLWWSIELYHGLDRIVVEGFDRKVAAISSVCGAFVRGEDHRKISLGGDEDGPLYKRYAGPLRRVRDSTGVTYLYSQELVDGRCRYVLDVSDEWDTIGAGEALSAEDYEGARNVMLHGVVHIGDIERTDNWGLLKYAYGPVYNDDGTVEAMVGADVNIGVIRTKMRTALYSVSMMCLAALLVGGYASVRISRRLAEPVNRVRQTTLRVAGGDYDEPITARQPTEMRRLAERFNAVAASLAHTLRSFQAEQHQAHARTEIRQLTAAIDWESCGGHECRDETFACAVLNANAETKTASGWVITDTYSIGWIAPRADTALDTVRRRADIARIARAIVDTRPPTAEDLRNRLEQTAGSHLVAVVVRKVSDASIAYTAMPDTLLSAGPPQKLALLTTGSLRGRWRLGADDIVVLADESGAPHCRDVSSALSVSCESGSSASIYIERIREKCEPMSDHSQRFYGVWRG